MPRQAHDRLFKSLVSAPDAALALLRHALPPAALRGTEPLDLQIEDSALPARKRARVADLRLSLRLPDRRIARFLLEHQTRPDPDMPFRALEEALAACRPPGRRPSRRPLPRVVPVVVYQGKAPWTAPTELADRFERGGPWLEAMDDQVPRFRHLLVDLNRTPDEALPAHPRLRLGLLLLKHAHARDPWTVLLRAAAEVRAVHQELGVEGLRPYLDYAMDIARHRPPRDFDLQLSRATGYAFGEVYMGLASQLRREGRQEGHKEGHQEGLQRGEIVGQRKLLARLLERRFGPLTPELAARLDAADLDQIARWTDQLLSAGSAAAALAD